MAEELDTTGGTLARMKPTEFRDEFCRLNLYHDTDINVLWHYLDLMHDNGFLHRPKSRQFPGNVEGACQFISELYDVLDIESGTLEEIVQAVRMLKTLHEQRCKMDQEMGDGEG